MRRGFAHREVGIDERRERSLRLALRGGKRREHGGAEHGGRQRVSDVRRHDIAPPVSTGVVGDRGAI